MPKGWVSNTLPKNHLILFQGNLQKNFSQKNSHFKCSSHNVVAKYHGGPKMYQSKFIQPFSST